MSTKSRPRHAHPGLAGGLLALMLVAAAPAGAVEPPGVTLSFTGLRSHAGEIRVEVYDSAQAWARADHPWRRLAVPAAPGTPQVRLDGVPPGQYAIRAFHDLDGDGRLRTGAFGAPTEPYAFSNNARGRLGPAPWSAASFTVVYPGASQSIRID